MTKGNNAFSHGQRETARFSRELYKVDVTFVESGKKMARTEVGPARIRDMWAGLSLSLARLPIPSFIIKLLRLPSSFHIRTKGQLVPQQQPTTVMASSSRTAIQPLTSEQQEAVIKQRMQVDERSLRRLVKKLTLLLSSKDLESVSSSRLSFKADLESFRLQLLRLSSIAHGTCQVEIQSYASELSEIELEQQATQQRIDALKQKLQDVRRERKNKLEYDVVAGDIVKLPTRKELEESLGRLSEQLAGVSAEREKYADMSREGAGRTGEAIRVLDALRNDVGYEVGERERREVERADGDADGETGDGTAAAGSNGNLDDGSESGSAARKGRKGEDETEEGEEEEGEQGQAASRSGSSTPRRPIAVERDDAAVPSLNPSAPTFRPSSTAAAVPASSSTSSTRRKRDSTAVTASDEEGELADGSSSSAAASNSNTPRKRQRTEEGEVATAGESEEEEGSIQPSAAAGNSSSKAVRAGTKRPR